MGDAVVVTLRGNQGGLEKFAFAQIAALGALAAGDDLRAFLLADFHIFGDGVHLAGVHLRAHLGVVFPRQADFHFFEFFCQRGHEFIVNTLLHENARAGAAHLALVEQNAFLRALERFVERHIVEEDIGRFAAQFERGGNQHFGGGNAHMAADFGGAGEGQLIEAFVVQHVFAGFGAAAGNHIEHAFGQQMVDFLGKRKQAQRGAG